MDTAARSRTARRPRSVTSSGRVDGHACATLPAAPAARRDVRDAAGGRRPRRGGRTAGRRGRRHRADRGGQAGRARSSTTCSRRSARVVVGQRDMVERVLIGLLTGGHCLIEGVPGLAKTLTVKTLSQTLNASFSAHPVHARSAAGRHHRHDHLQHAHRAVHAEAWPAVREPRARRRGQPRAGQGAVGAARGDAGAPGHDRRHDAPAARSVPRARDAEPDRAGGHVPAARGAARSLHAADQGQLPDARATSARCSIA